MRKLFCPKPHEPKRCPMPILRIYLTRTPICGNGRIKIPKLFAEIAKGEPGGCKIWRQLYSLHHQIGCISKIATQLQITPEIKAAVGRFSRKHHGF